MIHIVQDQIDREAVARLVSSPEAGALVTFEGTIRNHARGKKVTHLYYEAYSEMAQRALEKIRSESMRRWPIEAMAIVHRLGRMEIGESSVCIAVSSTHRADAFEACRFAIDSLKTKVPIWKKEHYKEGEVWIEGDQG